MKDHPINQLEPGTKDLDFDAAPMMSIAISLKRIADAMTETNEWGENTAEAIGGHLRRAMNDISATVHHTMSAGR